MEEGYQMRPAILTGEDAEEFEKYQRRKGTKEEIAYFRKCERIYRESCKPRKARKK